MNCIMSNIHKALSEPKLAARLRMPITKLEVKPLRTEDATLRSGRRVL